MPAPLRRILALAARSLSTERSLVSELRDRTRWSSIDLNGHMNYASYLVEMELGRWDWAFRSGAFGAFLSSRTRPVVVSVGIQYRRYFLQASINGNFDEFFGAYVFPG